MSALEESPCSAATKPATGCGPVQKWAVALITIAGIAPVEDGGHRGAAAPPSAPVDQSAGGDTRIRLVADNRHASVSDRF